MSKTIHIVLLCLCFLYAACSAPVISVHVPETKVPINASPYQLPSIGVAKIESSLPPGAVIGAHYDGWAKIKTLDYYAQGFVSAEWENQYKKIIAEELSSAGYSSPSQSNLFISDESFNTRYLLGGTIINSKLQSFGSYAGNYTEDLIDIDWQVFDKESRQVIFKAKTTGYSKIKGVTTEAGALAFRACVRNFLADPNLIQTLKNATSSLSKSTAAAVGVAYFEDNEQITRSKNRIEEVTRAVFAIKTEGGHGSGFVINRKGYALTNYHVIEGRVLFDAIFPDGKTIRVNVVKTDPSKDLALRKLTGEDYPFLAFADTKKLVLGQEVYAVGTPLSLGLSQTVSKGVISGIRQLEDITLIQTDASVNPGNSGGPLVTSDGNAVGIVSSKFAGSGVEGLGFAISIDEAIKAFQLILSKTI